MTRFDGDDAMSLGSLFSSSDEEKKGSVDSALDVTKSRITGRYSSEGDVK